MSKPIKLFIAASLVLNLLLAGIFLGNLGHSLIGTRVTRYSIQEMAQMLPPDRQQRFETTMQQAEQNMGDLRQRLSDARKHSTQILKAPTFDQSAYLAQTREIQQIHEEIVRRMFQAIAQWAAQASPEERTAIGDILRHTPRPSNEE